MRLKNPGRGVAVIKTPADLQKVRQHLLDLPVIEVISLEARCRNPCYLLGIMLYDLMMAFLVAFAAVTASGLLSRIWEYF